MSEEQMRSRILLPAMALAVLLGGTGCSDKAQPSQPPGKPAKLENMDYVSARKIILGYGWTPVRGACEGGGASETTCAGFPEIDYCSGVAPGYCTMAFSRKDRCLSITTTGGPPETREGDTHVEGVSFSACSKG